MTFMLNRQQFWCDFYDFTIKNIIETIKYVNLSNEISYLENIYLFLQYKINLFASDCTFERRKKYLPVSSIHF